MSEMVKRMARAMVRRRLCVALYNVDNVEKFVDSCWPVFEADAKAALEAMHEPTDAMVQAVRTAKPHDMDITESWPIAIDEALK